MRLILLLLLTFLCGCGSWEHREEEKKERSTSKTKQGVELDIDAEYPAPSNTTLNVSASGNSAITVELPTAEQKMSKLTNKTKGTASSEASFSLDYYIKSMSLGGWVAIILSLCLLGIVVYVLLQRTIIGRAGQQVAASGLKLTQSFVDELNEKVTHADPNSPEWKVFNEMKNRRQAELEYFRTSK